MEWKVRLASDRETRCPRLRHPGWQASEGAVGLEHDDELHAAGFEPSSGLHHFAEARMEPVADAGISRPFVGTM